MTDYKLEATKREVTGNRLEKLRLEGLVPAVLYGKGKESINLSVDKKSFNRTFSEAGETSLLELNVGESGGPRNVLIHDVQMDPVTDEPIHIDFYEVRMDEEIDTEVPLVFINESPAVKDLEGTLITNKTALEIRCLPGNIPHEIEVDISALATFDDSIQAKDIKLPANVEMITDSEETIAIVNPPRSEEELAALEGAVEENVEAVGESIEKEEKEDEEGADTKAEGDSSDKE